MLGLNVRRSTSSASTSPSSSQSPSPFSSAPSSPAARRAAGRAGATPGPAAQQQQLQQGTSSSALIPRAAVTLAEKEVVGDDSLGEAWKASIRGIANDAVAQRLVIHDTQEDAFYEELQQSVSELAHPGLLPVVGASKELSNDEDGTIDYLLVSRKCDITADQLLKQKKDEPLTLEARINWALSIAQALCFLYAKREDYFHGQVNLRHIQLDLKTQEAFLSCWAFQSFRSIRKGRPPTLSDFHWKAPEVLLKEKRRGSLSSEDNQENSEADAIDEQAADVYSFGIMLWELCSLKQAFTDYKSLGALIDGVSVRRHRPAIAEEWPESLGNLAQSCWDSDPLTRPKFADVAGRLQDVLLETSISDPLGREFWSTRFSGKNEVEMSVFQPSFYEFLGLPEPSKTNDVKCGCLLAILKELHEQNKDVVTIKTFSDMTHWFGPLEKGWRVIDRINELCAKPWFFGRISGKDAEEAVCKADKGAFLFRFSTSKPGSYAITVHSRRGGAKHFRVYHEPGLNYLIGKTECKSLDEIIFKFKADLNLLGPCPGSPFLELFKQDNFLKNRYDSWETEDSDHEEADLW